MVKLYFSVIITENVSLSMWFCRKNLSLSFLATSLSLALTNSGRFSQPMLTSVCNAQKSFSLCNYTASFLRLHGVDFFFGDQTTHFFYPQAIGRKAKNFHFLESSVFHQLVTHSSVKTAAPSVCKG